MTASTVKDVVQNLERYYDIFDGEKKSVDSVLDRIDDLLSRDVVLESYQGNLNYDALLKDLDSKLQKGWFMESAEVKQVDAMTIEYLARIMTDNGTMVTPRFRATIGSDFKITRIVSCDPVTDQVPNDRTVTDPSENMEENDSVLQKVKAELDHAYENDDGDLSTLGETQ